MYEYLNFPLQALNKDIHVEEFFKGLLDEEHEQNFSIGRKVEFDPTAVKRILENEDIDRGDVESDAGWDNGGGYSVSEKKCVAIV